MYRRFVVFFPLTQPEEAALAPFPPTYPTCPTFATKSEQMFLNDGLK